MTLIFKITICGARGSIPTVGSEFQKYGGETSCVHLNIDGEEILLDAGSGIRTAPLKTNKFSIFLSHFHYDHICGLLGFSPLFNPQSNIAFHGVVAPPETVETTLRRYLSPPFWPVGFDDFAANIKFHSYILSDKPKGFMHGDVTVRYAKTIHPNDGLVWSFEKNKKRLVYCTDFEHGTEQNERIISFARGADCLIYDATYSVEQYQYRVGWGHSTWNAADMIATAAGVSNLVMFHHDPSSTDDILDSAIIQFPGAIWARPGLEIEL